MTDELSIQHTLTTLEAQRAVLLAGPSFVPHEVAGEAYNPDQMRLVVDAVQGRTDAILPAWLMPEPENPHDSNAVVVWIFGGKVGYLPKELAATWQPILSQFSQRYGAHVACQAQIEPPSQANQGTFGVQVWLPTLTPPPQQAVAQTPALVTHAAPLSTTSPEELAKLREEIACARIDLEAARQELGAVEESLEIQSFGFYAPRYGFESSAQYVARLKGIRDEQRALLKSGKAAPCDTTWKVAGSAAEGKKMVRQQAKLMLRAFNGECDAAIAKVKYDNVAKLEARILKAYDAINKLGEVQRVFITQSYYTLKLAELHLVHEHREKVELEKEEQRQIRAQMREEQKAQQEIDRAQAEAEKEELASQAALAKAQHELALAEATSAQHEKLEALVTRLETELQSALDRKASAIARAQLTKSGHVYVLSNIGSFGEGIYKIGMTRRLEPLERVDELGDASVPFPFDVHAIIYAENAPALEASLHQAFADRRVNLVNQRKEYFRVTLDEVRQAVEKVHGLVTFRLVAEAAEYRKSVAAGSVASE